MTEKDPKRKNPLSHDYFDVVCNQYLQISSIKFLIHTFVLYNSSLGYERRNYLFTISVFILGFDWFKNY